jgi:hypothetical protein
MPRRPRVRCADRPVTVLVIARPLSTSRYRFLDQHAAALQNSGSVVNSARISDTPHNRDLFNSHYSGESDYFCPERNRLPFIVRTSTCSSDVGPTLSTRYHVCAVRREQLSAACCRGLSRTAFLTRTVNLFSLGPFYPEADAEVK